MTDSHPPETIRTVRDAVERIAAQKGEDTFLHHGDRTVSYAELDRRANAIANELYAQGVTPGDHVCLYLYNSLEYVCTYFALAKMGAVVLPIDTRFTGNTLSYIISNSEANVIFVDGETLESYESVRNRVSNLTAEYFIGERTADHPYREFDELLEGDRDTSPDVSVSETDPLSLTYVQQSPTERPSGVVLPHFSYVNTGWESGRNLFDFSQDDRIFTTLPVYSIFTSQVGIMGALLARSEFVLENRFEPAEFWDRIDAYDATAFLYLSRMLSVLYNQDVKPTGGTTSANVAIGHSFGFVTDEDLFRGFEKRFDVTVLEGYGVTQSGALATYNCADDRRIGSVGKPISSVDVAVVDEKDRPVPTGKSGEIVIRPLRPNTMLQRYYGDPERTVEDCRNQWIHTGDIGYKDDDGYLYFIADQANSIYRDRVAGRISALEIESVINTLPAVRTSAVIGVRNERGEEEIKAIVVAEADVDLSPAEVCKHCQQQLPYLKIPRFIEVRNDLPRNPSGKVRKKDLRDEGVGDAWDRESGYELSR